MYIICVVSPSVVFWFELVLFGQWGGYLAIVSVQLVEVTLSTSSNAAKFFTESTVYTCLYFTIFSITLFCEFVTHS